MGDNPEKLAKRELPIMGEFKGSTDRLRRPLALYGVNFAETVSCTIVSERTFLQFSTLARPCARVIRNLVA